MIEKKEDCPKCGKNLSQIGYDMQTCTCGWSAMMPAMTTIHESEYGGSSMNFHVEKSGDTLRISLTYPPRSNEENEAGQCRYIFANQESVRASDGIRLHYDYERDGFVIEQPKTRLRKLGPNSYLDDPVWIETGFFKSWHFDVDDDSAAGQVRLIAEADQEYEKGKSQ